MDAKEFQQRIASAPFTRVEFSSNGHPPLLEGIVDGMLEMEDRGFEFALDIHHCPLNEKPVISTRRPPGVSFQHQQDVHAAMRAFLTEVLEIKGPDNTLRGLELAILLGIDDYLTETGMGKKEVPVEFFVYSGLFSQLLPVFLLEISPEERKYFWLEFEKNLPQENKWHTIFCGALAVARIMYAFGRRADIWLPPIYYDLHFGGDLIARTDMATLYIQVKGRGKMERNPLKLTVLRKSPRMSCPPSEWERGLNKLWSGSRQFTLDIGIPVIPLVAEVNIDDSSAMWEIGECSGLLSIAAHFLDSLPEATASLRS